MNTISPKKRKNKNIYAKVLKIIDETSLKLSLIEFLYLTSEYTGKTTFIIASLILKINNPS